MNGNFLQDYYESRNEMKIHLGSNMSSKQMEGGEKLNEFITRISNFRDKLVVVWMVKSTH